MPPQTKPIAQSEQVLSEADALPNDTKPELSDSDSIEYKIAENVAKLRQYKRRTLPILILALVFMPGGLTIAFFAPALENTLGIRIGPSIGLITAAYSFLAFLMSAFLRMNRISSFEQENDVLAAKKWILAKSTGLSTSAEAPTYFDRLVDINVTNLGQYYTLVKYQTNNSFLVSIGVGVFGFALIFNWFNLGFL